MNKYFIISFIIIVALISGLFIFNSYIYTAKQAPSASLGNYQEVEYLIEDELVRIGSGVEYFGNELYKDLDGDGREDVVFLVTRETGGSGTFFYAVAVLNTEEGYVGSRGIFLGDRIAPQTIESGPGAQVVINYVDRAEGEPMSTAPSVGKTVRLIFDSQSMQFGEVASDFEGEADPARMSLGMKEWQWVKAEYNDGSVIIPNKPELFSLTFLENGRVEARTDCNNGSGTYEVDGDTLIFGPMMTTLMYCEGSQETEFMQLLSNTDRFHFTSWGELTLSLKYDSGTVTFR